MGLKLLANIFATPKGRAAMADEAKAMYLIEFCAQSMSSCNPKVTFHAAITLFNYLLAFENSSRKPLQEVLESSIKAACDVLTRVNLTDKDTLVALLLSICRCLYKNHDLTVWVETAYKNDFKQTMAGLEERSQGLAVEVRQALKDV